MTREDLIFEIKRRCFLWLNNKTISKKHALECLLGILDNEESQLSPNLDEVTEEYFLKTYGLDNIAISEDIKRAVKFGAEWMARQGITEVSRLYRDPNPPHEGLFFGVLPFFSTIEMALNYQEGEEVIVQIRKKQ